MGYPIEIHFGRNLDKQAEEEVKPSPLPQADRAVVRPRTFSRHSRGFLADLTSDSALPSSFSSGMQLDISPLLMFLSSRELERIRSARRPPLPSTIQAASVLRSEEELAPGS